MSEQQNVSGADVFHPFPCRLSAGVGSVLGVNLEAEESVREKPSFPPTASTQTHRQG